MTTLFLSRPLTKNEMAKIMRGLSDKEKEKIKFWLDKDGGKDMDPQIQIGSNTKQDVLAVKKQLKHIKGVKIL